MGYQVDGKTGEIVGTFEGTRYSGDPNLNGVRGDDTVGKNSADLFDNGDGYPQWSDPSDPGNANGDTTGGLGDDTGSYETGCHYGPCTNTSCYSCII